MIFVDYWDLSIMGTMFYW